MESWCFCSVHFAPWRASRPSIITDLVLLQCLSTPSCWLFHCDLGFFLKARRMTYNYSSYPDSHFIPFTLSVNVFNGKDSEGTQIRSYYKTNKEVLYLGPVWIRHFWLFLAKNYLAKWASSQIVSGFMFLAQLMLATWVHVGKWDILYVKSLFWAQEPLFYQQIWGLHALIEANRG